MPASFPPAPWILVGRAIIVPALLRPGGSGSAPGGGARRTLGGLLVGDYDAHSTLPYRELLGVEGIEWSSLLPAARVTVARVDHDGSVAGGRALWGIPKARATFAWHESPSGVEVTVTDPAGGVATVVARSRRRGRSMPVLGRFVGVDGRPAWVQGRLHGALARVRVHVPPGSPLAGSRPAYSSVGWLGEVSLRVRAPRREGA